MTSSLWSLRSWSRVNLLLPVRIGRTVDRVQVQPVRLKGGILPHKKPRWVGPAKSKMFIFPKKYFAPESEIVQLNILKVRYQEHFSALTQYLYEDYLKNSDLGEVAKVEAQREQEEHDRLTRENEEENARVAELREQRLRREMDEERVKVAEVKVDAERRKVERKRQAAEIVRAETESLEKRIQRDDLERAIMQALDNPADHEYAIDREGYIYRGRYTRSTLVPEADREKIPTPPNTYDLLREESKRDS